MRILDIAWTAWFGIVAAAVASFAGVVADRLPRGESIVSGPSRCRNCGRRLGALDLVPVAGYLLRRGRCPVCRTRVPVVYPLTEGAAAAAVVAACLLLGPVLGGVLGIGLLLAATACVAGVAGWWGRRRRRPAADPPTR